MAHSIYNTADELVGGGERMREAERDGILREAWSVSRSRAECRLLQPVTVRKAFHDLSEWQRLSLGSRAAPDSTDTRYKEHIFFPGPVFSRELQLSHIEGVFS